MRIAKSLILNQWSMVKQWPGYVTEYHSINLLHFTLTFSNVAKDMSKRVGNDTTQL